MLFEHQLHSFGVLIMLSLMPNLHLPVTHEFTPNGESNLNHQHISENSDSQEPASQGDELKQCSELNKNISAEAKISIVNPIYSALVIWISNMILSVERMTLWVCGVILATTGWLVTGKIAETYSAKIYFSTASILFGLLGIGIVASIHKNYIDIVKTISQINKFQMVYSRNVYLKDETLFPHRWSEFDLQPLKRRLFSFQEQPIFRVSYAAFAIVSIFGALAVWLL